VACIQKKDDKRDSCTILKIPDELWKKIRIVLPKEKPPKTMGRPTVPFRKALDGVPYILRTGCQWKMLPSGYGSGSTCHRRFQEWVKLDIFRKIWIRLLKTYDSLIGIKWAWQSLDMVSIRSPLGGDDRKQSN
jgi:transposase